MASGSGPAFHSAQEYAQVALSCGPLIEQCLTYGNMNGIKEEPKWPLHEFTYFLLPGPRIQAPKNIKRFDFADFVQFWHQLSNVHKERRLLVAWTCAHRGFEQVMRRKVIAPFPVLARTRTEPQKMALFVDQMRILVPMVDGYVRILRRLFIDDQLKTGRDGFLRTLQQSMTELAKMDWSDTDTHFPMTKAFRGPWENAGIQAGFTGHVLLEVVGECSKVMLQTIFNNFLELYMGWKQSPDQKRYMKKLRAAVPHWSAEDRDLFMKGANSQSATDYAADMVKKWGSEKFKQIAFGKEKFCANCKKSSYAATDRLWACKRCVLEKVRHKARYCNVECQKAHWIKHRSGMHSVHSCATCGRKETAGQPKLRGCTRCLNENPGGAARYCNVECQKAHWPEHKKTHLKTKMVSGKK